MTKHPKLKASQEVSIEITNQSLENVKAQAKLNNVSYQTLLRTLIHKFAQGKIKLSI